jgi:class 3 adenylate cyclase
LPAGVLAEIAALRRLAIICTKEAASMPEQRVERKLVAILAADVAGYSRLVGLDEEGTLARLKTLRREVIDPEIASHRGRIVKTTGDGLLIEFASVVDAVLRGRGATGLRRARNGTAARPTH